MSSSDPCVSFYCTLGATPSQIRTPSTNVSPSILTTIKGDMNDTDRVTNAPNDGSPEVATEGIRREQKKGTCWALRGCSSFIHRVSDENVSDPTKDNANVHMNDSTRDLDVESEQKDGAHVTPGETENLKKYRSTGDGKHGMKPRMCSIRPLHHHP